MFLRATEHNMRGRGGSDGEQEERRERRRASSSRLNTWMWMECPSSLDSTLSVGSASVCNEGRNSDLFTPATAALLCPETGTCDLHEDQE